MTTRERIGFMQGRLSDLVDGRIQAFPWATWRAEFPQAEALGLRLMEWTLDQDRLYDNPLLTLGGQAEIRALCTDHALSIPSLTGDCFMQAPFWKSEGAARQSLKDDFLAVADACATVGIAIIVVPLVDNGRLERSEQEDTLIEFLLAHRGFMADRGLRVAFESDFAPIELARFIGRLDQDRFGVNYDSGNSAALGFDPAAEFAAYGSRIINVHVKDRLLGGTTVPLGTGATQFEQVFAYVRAANYRANFILQTARATDGDHARVLGRYRDMTETWMSDSES